MRLKLFFILLALTSILSSCSSDHDHDMYGYNTYPYPYYNNRPYYYYNGVYYEDPYHTHPYAWDNKHFYSARIEWKGSNFGYAVVLRENPYMGMICRPTNLLQPFTHDCEVMVRFNWLGEENNNGLIIPIIEIIDMHYR
ncbi:MAG: hypothetical protein MJZ33_02035 [Paludibacteraceae bacterium]|nr:hypothetical protein [Paludibacteraceae bacterium]